MIRNQSEFLSYALKSYDNPKIISLCEFETDLKRFSYLNSMVKKYKEDNDQQKLRIIINHIIIISNVFGVKSSIEMIRFKTPDDCKDVIETSMYFLNLIESSDSLNLNILNTIKETTK